ncbi:MAG: molecular chaperone HtpG [Oscillospiraceae bacterium]
MEKEKKEFKAESKRLLEMMINSIYTHKEIFLRELISNASDAIDKLYFKSLTDDTINLKKDDFFIQIRSNKEDRTITISDNGIGMDNVDLENNLGVIAKSGSLAFKSENGEESKKDVDIIGQFGVGFYSAFMVSKLVTVTSKAYGSEQAYKWQSEGVDGYTIEPCEKSTTGTDIVLTLKDDTEDEKYSEYLDCEKLEELIKKYSDYIRFPIKLEKVITEKNDKDEEETIVENNIVNSMVPIWKKNKSELTDEDYNKFYHSKFMDFDDPIIHMHIKTEGLATYNAVLYIPKRPEYDYYTKDFEKGLQLYSNGVLIMDKCPDLIPDHFSFVRGIVDSEDLSLNISREMLQHDRQVKIISRNIEKTIKNELTKLMETDREKYELFFKEFGIQLKAGIQGSFDSDIRDTLKDLLIFYSLKQDKYITFKEYCDNMAPEQEYIFYATGESISKIKQLPQADLVKEKGFDILCCDQNIDEFCLRVLFNYNGKLFKSIADNDLGLQSKEELEEIKTKSEENKDLFSFMNDVLKGKVVEVRLSTRLKEHPVCLTAKGQISIDMEKVLTSMPNQPQVNAEKILEINPNHNVFQSLKDAFNDGDKDKVTKYTKLLYSQALLIEGLFVENPVEFSNQICDLMI